MFRAIRSRLLTTRVTVASLRTMSSDAVLIQPEEVLARPPSSQIIVDVRHDLAKPEKHIAGAVFAHLDSDLSGPITAMTGRHPLPSVDQLVQVFSRFGIDEEKDVVVYDQSQGQFAGRLWWLLRWLGHDRVRLLDRGFPGWIAKDLPVRAGAHANTASRFVARSRPEMIADLSTVEAVYNDPAWLLVDGRSVERHEGLVEPIDPIAGSIPNSSVRFHMENLQGPDKMQWKTPEQLANGFVPLISDFDKVLGSHSPEKTIMYCGSGVTAIHNLMALEMTGRRGSSPLTPGVKLYPGSWSEWIRNPAHPIYSKK